MNKIWTNKLKETLIWLCGYLNIVAFAIVGGYAIVKSENEDLKKATKTAFIVTLIFTAISAFLAIFNYCGNISKNYYGSSAYDFYTIASSIVGIAKIVVFAVFIIMTLLKKEEKVVVENAPKEEK